jgi:phage-related protein
MVSGDENTVRIPLVFHHSLSGNEPVRDWLKDLLRVQYRWPVGMPLCRQMGGGLWEVRTSLPSKTIARVLICFLAGVLAALRAFVKKTQKTPDEDLNTARKRMKEVENGQQAFGIDARRPPERGRRA